MSKKEFYSNQVDYIEKKSREVGEKGAPLVELLKQAGDTRDDSLYLENGNVSFWYSGRPSIRPVFVDQAGTPWIGKVFSKREFIQDVYGANICKILGLNVPEIKYKKIDRSDYHLSRFLVGSRQVDCLDLNVGVMDYYSGFEVRYFLEQNSLVDEMQRAIFPRLLIAKVSDNSKKTLNSIALDSNPENYLFYEDGIFQVDFANYFELPSYEIVTNFSRYGCTFNPENVILKEQLKKVNHDWVDELIGKTFERMPDFVEKEEMDYYRKSFEYTFLNLDRVVGKFYEIECGAKLRLDKLYQQFLELNDL